LRNFLKSFINFREKKFRFIVAGAINTTAGLTIYPILYLALTPLGFGYVEILLIAQFICISFSFITNKYFVFKTKKNTRKEYLKFFIFHGFYAILNLIFLPFLVDVMKFSPIISQIIFTIPIIAISYFWHSHITFYNSEK